MPRFPRLARLLARRPRPASLLAVGTAVIILGAAGTIAASDATPADFAPKSDAVTTYNDGWIDGRADLMGDDNRDGRVDEDETGWDCATMGNRECGPGVPPQCKGEAEYADLCATVAKRPAYAWTDNDGTPHTVAAGRKLLTRIDAVPGTEEFGAALFALDAQWFEHNQP
ncbi:hypothetical protein SAMN05216483_6689 [Streptomyces sp. 2131.1]|uniref:hypothetical protein n=1 Tax=Streptomyces sp. 2131.1 TaxID=1855346 RepID=UPI0008942226|nr:hypothetical protein [Streptomyces sp. 2131.1]SEE82976.1 hypothetical protein SAMN05216483_6689 [Streptomyces sp. 2131.1]